MVGLAFVSQNDCFAAIASGTSGTCKWVIKDDGQLVVSPVNGVKGELYNNIAGWTAIDGESHQGCSPWRQYAKSITSVLFKGTVVATSCYDMFYGCFNLKSIEWGEFKTDKVTDMACMFEDCSSLVSLDLSSFDVSNVTNMACMFKDCSSLKSLNLSGLNTSNVTIMARMFYYCESFVSLDLSSFNTSKVTNMKSMFHFCKSLTSLDVSKFNTKRVTDMEGMFCNCTSLSKLNLTNFVTTNAKIDNLFLYNSKLTTIISNADTPSKLKDKTFSSLATLGTCKLTCPSASKSKYKKADGWKHLFATTTGIEEIESTSDDTQQPSAVFSTNGTRLSAPRKGINIIGGRKVVVRN